MKRKPVLIFYLLCWIQISLLAQSDSSYMFTLNEATHYAIENNYDIQNASLDIVAARKRVWETTAIGLPQANGKLDYQHLPGELPTLDFPNPEGGTQKILLGVKNSTTYSVTVSQLVFSGEYIVGLQASRTYLQLSKNAYEKQEDEIKANVAGSYYTILVLEQNKQIIDSSLLNMQVILKETKAMAENGFLEQTDYEQIQVTLNTLENSARAIKRQIETSYKLFKIQLGIPIENEVVLSESLNDFLLTLNSDQLIEQPFDLNQNIDYRVMVTQEEIQALTVKREKSLFLPTVSAFYLYQDRTNKPDFDITFNHILGVNVSVPIFASGQKLARVQQAEIELDKTKNSKNQVSESLFMAVEQARSNFRNALDKYKTEQKNIKLTKRIYDRTVIKYKEGMSSSMDLTQANNQFLNANSAYTNAVMELLTAAIELEKALNSL